MSVEQLIKKERRMHEFGFVEERGVFSLLVDCCPFPFSISFYIIGNHNPFSTKIVLS